MPTKEELAAQAKVDQLKQLAADNEVDLGDATTKDDIVAAITASNKVTKDQIDAVVNAPDDTSGGSSSTALETTEEEPSSLTTSHVDSHIEGVVAADVEPDTPTGDKPSDAGPERYPFPAQGDVDVATIPDTPKKVAKAEHEEPLTGGDVWVRLGKHNDVPEELQGHLAVVIDSSTYETDDGAEALDKSKPITVRTRDEHDARLQIPFEAVEAVSRRGSIGVGARA